MQKSWFYRIIAIFIKQRYNRPSFMPIWCFYRRAGGQWVYNTKKRIFFYSFLQTAAAVDWDWPRRKTLVDWELIGREKRLKNPGGLRVEEERINFLRQTGMGTKFMCFVLVFFVFSWVWVTHCLSNIFELIWWCFCLLNCQKFNVFCHVTHVCNFF